MWIMKNSLCNNNYCQLRKLCLNYTDDPNQEAKKYNFSKINGMTRCDNFIKNFQKEKDSYANTFIRH